MPATAPQLKLVDSPADLAASCPERLALVAFAPLRRDPETGALIVTGKTVLARTVTVSFSRALAAELVHSFANLLLQDPELREREVHHVDPHYSKALPSIEYRGPFVAAPAGAKRPTLADLQGREEPETPRPRYKCPAMPEAKIEEVYARMVETGCTVLACAQQIGCSHSALSMRLTRRYGHGYLRAIARERAARAPVLKPNGTIL